MLLNEARNARCPGYRSIINEFVSGWDGMYSVSSLGLRECIHYVLYNLYPYKVSQIFD